MGGRRRLRRFPNGQQGAHSALHLHNDFRLHRYVLDSLETRRFFSVEPEQAGASDLQGWSCVLLHGVRIPSDICASPLITLIHNVFRFAVNTVATTFIILDLNPVMSVICDVPAAVVSTIVASRAVRRLTEFTSAKAEVYSYVSLAPSFL